MRSASSRVTTSRTNGSAFTVGRHAALDLGEVVRRQWPRQIEVVVEAVLDGRADPKPGVREYLQHRFCHEVGRRVAHARQLVRPGVLQVDRDVHAGDVVVGVCHLGLSALVQSLQLPVPRAAGKKNGPCPQ